MGAYPPIYATHLFARSEDVSSEVVCHEQGVRFGKRLIHSGLFRTVPRKVFIRCMPGVEQSSGEWWASGWLILGDSRRGGVADIDRNQ
jgi:hypothetical protein